MTMDYMENFGHRVKELRQQQGVTLRKLAEETGLSVGYLSKVERGLHMPSYTTVQKISYALKVTANELTAESEPPQPVKRPNSPVIIRGEHRSLIYGVTDLFRFESVYEFDGDPGFKLNIMTLNPDCSTAVDSIHSYDEFGIVTEGKMHMELEGFGSYDLEAGDCILVKANTRHSTNNPHNSRCVSYWFEIVK